MVVPGTDGSSASLTRCTRLSRCRHAVAGNVMAVTEAAHVMPYGVSTLHHPGLQSSMTAAASRGSSPQTHEKQCERGSGMNGFGHLLIGCQVCFPAGGGRPEAVLVPQLVLLLQYAVERQLDGLPAALVLFVLLRVRGQHHIRSLCLTHTPFCGSICRNNLQLMTFKIVSSSPHTRSFERPAPPRMRRPAGCRAAWQSAHGTLLKRREAAVCRHFEGFF